VGHFVNVSYINIYSVQILNTRIKCNSFSLIIEGGKAEAFILLLNKEANRNPFAYTPHFKSLLISSQNLLHLDFSHEISPCL